MVENPTQRDNSENQSVSSTSLRLATLAAITANGTPAANYWLAPLGGIWFLPALFMLMAAAFLDYWAVGYAIAGFTNGRQLNAIGALTIVVSGALGFWYVPYYWVNVLVDFHLFRNGREEIAELAQLPVPPLERGVVLTNWPPTYARKLPPRYAGYSYEGEFLIEDTSCGRYVFLTPDGFTGFLFVPPCVKAKDFSRVFSDHGYGYEVEPIVGSWHYIGG